MFFVCFLMGGGNKQSISEAASVSSFLPHSELLQHFRESREMELKS